MTTANVSRLARTIRAARESGPVEVRRGTTTGAPVAGVVEVEWAGRRVPVEVPGSFRANVAAGQEVTFVQKSEGQRILESIVTPLATPTVAAPPGNAGTSGVSPGVNNTGSSGTYDYTIGDNDWNAVRAYTRDIASSTRGIAGDVNELRDDVGWNADDIVSLKNTVNAMAATLNSLKTTVAALRTALIDQGHVV